MYRVTHLFSDEWWYLVDPSGAIMDNAHQSDQNRVDHLSAQAKLLNMTMPLHWSDSCMGGHPSSDLFTKDHQLVGGVKNGKTVFSEKVYPTMRGAKIWVRKEIVQP